MGRLKLVPKQSQSQKNRGSNEIMLMHRYTHQSQTTYFFTGKSIDRQYFDIKNQIVKSSYMGYQKFNVLLTKQRQRIEDIINSAMANEINPTIDYVKSIYNTDKEDKSIRLKMSFWDFVDEFIKEAKTKLNPNTVRSYNNIINNLKEFEKFEKAHFDWQSFDVKFYYKFFEFYTGYKQLGNNGFGKVIRVLKSILNSATDRGFNTNLSYKSKEFKALREDVDNTYLDESELKTIIDLDLSDCKKLERTRDLFIVGCYTGLRFSDLSQLAEETFSGKIISIKTIKTGAEVVLPILDEVRTIVNKYNGKLPKAYSNQKANEYLKIIAKRAELCEKVHKHYSSGNKTIKETFEKWEVICTHTARRSFATNMYKRGVDAISIMKLTGHLTEKSFMTYIKITKEENAFKILEQFKKSA